MERRPRDGVRSHVDPEGANHSRLGEAPREIPADFCDSMCRRAFCFA